MSHYKAPFLRCLKKNSFSAGSQDVGACFVTFFVVSSLTFVHYKKKKKLNYKHDLIKDSQII